MIQHLIKAHRFFVTQSPLCIGPYTCKERLYYPIAYIRFMRFYWDDCVLQRQQTK